MSTTLSAPISEISRLQRKVPAKPQRLASVDLLRGAALAAMIVVNSQASDEAYWPFRHAKWNGCSPADVLFPLFLFVVGVSLVLSMQFRLSRGDSRRGLLFHALQRSAVIFALGLLLNGPPGFHLAAWRIPGVLQRIALAYCAAAIITLYSRSSTIVGWVIALLLGYWVVLRFVPVPGYGMPGRQFAFLDPTANLASYVDRRLMPEHLYSVNYDPEGLVSTLPAIATALIGVLTGKLLCSRYRREEKVAGMLVLGVAGIVAGKIFGRWFPFNKALWTSSYVLFTAGLDLILLALCYWTTDVKQHRPKWCLPFLMFGSNAITAYVIAELLTIPWGWQDYFLQHSFEKFGNPALASLLYALTLAALCFLPVWWMYRRRIFLKI